MNVMCDSGNAPHRASDGLEDLLRNTRNRGLAFLHVFIR